MTHGSAPFGLASNPAVGGLTGLLRSLHALFPVPWSRERTPRTLLWLSPQAKALLREALRSEARSLHAPAVPGGAIGLELADVISISRDGDGTFVLAVNAWAAEALRRRPELLAG